MDFILNMENSEQIPEPSKIYYFSVFFQSAAAGIGRLSEINDYQMEELELKTLPAGASLVCILKGQHGENYI